MHRNKSASAHHFGITPQADIPRSAFRIQKTWKSTFDAGFLIPCYVDEVMPGDSFSVRQTSFVRMATPIVPVMDNLHLDTFYFAVPFRLLWDNWHKFMGEQKSPGDSISFTIPQLVSPTGGFGSGTIWDFMGLPTVGQVDPGATLSVSALWSRAYNLIWNEWFRDQNLQNALEVSTGDGPDNTASYALQRRGKRPDYFTTCLPWPQKGEAVSLPLGTSAPVISNPSGHGQQIVRQLGSSAPLVNKNLGTGPSGELQDPVTPFADAFIDPSGAWVADLSAATAATINQLRQAAAIQHLLERDARGGTRLTELIYRHFGVKSPDARLQRPEYLGGGSTPIITQPVAQTSGSPPGGTGYTDTPLGTLGGVTTGTARGHGFSQSFTEHCVIIGLMAVRADITYQQGLRRMWSRKTRFDFYWPEFAHLGEQPVLNKEIYCTGLPSDDDVFGYQERWAEYRYQPSEITGLFRSTVVQPLDNWHLAQNFTSAPVLGDAFIKDQPPVERVVAVGAAAGGQQLLCDSFFEIRAARPMPTYSIPGLVGRF